MIDRHHHKLDDQLDVIAEVLAITQAETDDMKRTELLAVIGRAVAAAEREHRIAVQEDHDRPKLRLIIGGLGTAAAPIGACAATLARIRHHPVTVAAASTAAAALAVAGLLVLGMNGRNVDAGRAPVGPVSTSSTRTVPDAVDEAPAAPTTPGTGAPTTVPEVPAADAAYSSPVGTTPPASSTLAAPHAASPSTAQTSRSAPPSTSRPPESPPPTTAPTTAGPPDRQAGCLRLALLGLADADVCLLAAG